MSDKAWGGRFEEELDAIAARFSASVDIDGRLWPQDIRGSIAHVRMLADRSILSREDAELIEKGLSDGDDEGRRHLIYPACAIFPS